MKNRPLALQIWLVFAGLTLGISLLLMIITPWTLKGFFTEQMYRTIRESQELYLASDQVIAVEDLNKWDQRRQQYRSVEHMVFLGDGRILTGLPSTPIEQNYQLILQEALMQNNVEQQYERQVGEDRIYYVIRRGQLAGQPAFLLSYMWGSYQEDLVGKLWSKLLWVIAGLLIMSWLPSFWLARYLTRPLLDMEKHVERIAQRDWQEEIDCNRRDEIGRLGSSIESMRRQLASQSQAQQVFLQQISHDLKTPVMIIRSYAQAIADGIFPREDLAGSIQVIDEESARLEKRISDLLYLTKLDHLAGKESLRETIYLPELIEHVVDSFRYRRPELNWLLDLQEDIIMEGDCDQWKTVLENLLDNQIRYARSEIRISVNSVNENDQTGIELRIGNDGVPIEDKVIDNMFTPYSIGERGQYGLGLAIVKQVADKHHAEIKVCNHSSGPTFCLFIPR